MARLIWSSDAVDDVENIVVRIERNSPANARAFAQQVDALANSLPQQPRLGGMVPEYGDQDLRERLIHKYRVIYRLIGDDVVIVTVVHGAQRLPRTPPG
jgi:plasmid stabilization system protein ParE